MQLGIFAKTFSGTIDSIFQSVAAHGLTCVQFNMSCVGLETLPERIERVTCERIRHAAEVQRIAVPAVSGTFNMIHPDVALRREGLKRLAVLASACPDLGATMITLCTGTRDAQNMWRRHPDNDSPESWSDLVASTREALRATDPRVILAFEPEAANVVDSAAKARRLLDEMASPRLRVVFDAANFFQPANIQQMPDVLREAVELLGPDIVIAHAKDVRLNGELQHVAAGKGTLNYDDYLPRLLEIGFAGPLILHGLAENEVSTSVRFVRTKLEEAFRGGH